MPLELNFKEFHSFLHIVLSLHCKCLPTMINFYTFPLHTATPTKSLLSKKNILPCSENTVATCQIFSNCPDSQRQIFFHRHSDTCLSSSFSRSFICCKFSFFCDFLSCNNRAMASCWMTQLGLTASGS